MKDLLIYILKAIVDNPDEVVVEESSDDTGLITLRATVAESDMGKVIGKGGKVINSIRQVVKIPAIKQGKRLTITLSEPEVATLESTPTPPEEAPSKDKTEKLEEPPLPTETVEDSQ